MPYLIKHRATRNGSDTDLAVIPNEGPLEFAVNQEGFYQAVAVSECGVESSPPAQLVELRFDSHGDPIPPKPLAPYGLSLKAQADTVSLQIQWRSIPIAASARQLHVYVDMGSGFQLRHRYHIDSQGGLNRRYTGFIDGLVRFRVATVSQAGVESFCATKDVYINTKAPQAPMLVLFAKEDAV